MKENTSKALLLGSTAYWTASVRAVESSHLDRLFNDPWAAALAGEVGRRWIESRSPESIIPIILRTRFFDDFLQNTTHQHSVRQVVLVAAGLDTRAFRLSWPEHTRLFELDQGEILEYKNSFFASSAVKPTCERRTIEIDLTTTWAGQLKSSGFDSGRPSVWLLEGFLFYLSNEHLAQILEQVSGLASPGSWAGFDVINSTTLTSEWTKPWIEMQARAGAPWIGTLDDPESFLEKLGWKASLTQAGADDADHGRWPYPVLPINLPNVPHNWFVTAEKIS